MFWHYYAPSSESSPSSKSNLSPLSYSKSSPPSSTFDVGVISSAMSNSVSDVDPISNGTWFLGGQSQYSAGYWRSSKYGTAFLSLPHPWLQQIKNQTVSGDKKGELPCIRQINRISCNPTDRTIEPLVSFPGPLSCKHLGHSLSNHASFTFVEKNKICLSGLPIFSRLSVWSVGTMMFDLWKWISGMKY